jgi:gliding motility-associated-like protein
MLTNQFHKIYILLFLSFFVINKNAFAQKEGAIWYFGIKAGLDFNTNPPTPLSNSQMRTNEGCFSIADPSSGQLLFYSDGRFIWGRNHQLMPSIPAGGLGGDSSSTQSGIVIPDPANPNRYYVFSVAKTGGPSLFWAQVDMTLNGGDGDLISSKNVLLNPPCEKIASIGNCATNEFWVLSHKFVTDSFFAWKVSATGISSPVATKIGSLIAGPVSGTIGYLKFSPDGKKVAVAHSSPINKLEIFDFDINTGILSNTVSDTFMNAYGCSFSPNSKLLYVASNRTIIQYDVSLSSASNIVASRNTIANNVIQYGALQNALDGKMYHAGTAQFSATGGSTLNLINNPNKYGAACNFVLNAVNLNGKATLFGLPSIVENFLIGQNKMAPPLQNVICVGGNVEVNKISSIELLSVAPSDGVSFNIDSSIVSFSPITTTTYTIKYKTKGFCNVVDSLVFTVQLGNVKAQFDVTPLKATLPNVQFNFTNRSLNATTFEWLSEGQIFSTASNPSIVKTDTGTFCFKLIAENDDGCADSITQCVTVEEAEKAIFIPNAFTPNNDKTNNTFKAIYDTRIAFEGLQIYDRWGTRIFSTTNSFEDWDGKYRGVECSIGVYYYLFKYHNKKDNVPITKKGEIHLIR